LKETDSILEVQTVLGPVLATSLGTTLPHEHILVDAGVYFNEPRGAGEKALAYQPVSLQNLSWVRSHRMNNADSLKLTDEPTAIQELLLYQRAGGKTIVDASTIGLGRNPAGLARVARASGLNIIMGTGFYIEGSYPADSLDQRRLAEEMVKEIKQGVGDSGIRAGVIGEIGCSFPLKESERVVLRACGRAQKQTGVALIVHPPGSAPDSIHEIVTILADAGADLRKTVFCHIDIMGFSLETIDFLVDTGCFVEVDTFGHLMAPFVFKGRVMDFPSDSQRIALTKDLIQRGYLAHILISQDTFLKELLVSYGGFGYAHILQNIRPVMQAKGISVDQIRAIMVDNPRRLLQHSVLPTPDI
jgi:phosphotriesterase-related protein